MDSNKAFPKDIDNFDLNANLKRTLMKLSHQLSTPNTDDKQVPESQMPAGERQSFGGCGHHMQCKPHKVSQCVHFRN